MRHLWRKRRMSNKEFKTKSMVRRKEKEELKQKFEERMARGKIRALEEEIKRINQAFE